jgi:formate hydrogenlyase subunit 4
MMERLLESLVQIVVLLGVSPLVSGIVKFLKARLQTRRGPSILQPYRDLHKLFRKGMVIPDTASWIFSATPYVVFLSALAAGLMIPLISTEACRCSAVCWPWCIFSAWHGSFSRLAVSTPAVHSAV